jgi:hypothetical protein
MSLPDNYRFTAKDVDHAYELISAHYDEATEEQMDIANASFIAEEMQKKSGTYPLMREVEAEFWKREDAHWQRNFQRNAPRTKEPEPDWKALLEKSAENERNAKK